MNLGAFRLLALLVLLVSGEAGRAATVLTNADFASLDSAIQNGGLVRLKFDGNISFPTNINVSKDVEVDATGRTVGFDGGGKTRLFKISGARVTLRSLSISGGRDQGIPLTSTVDGIGGAIFVTNGFLHLEKCVLDSNQAVGARATYASNYLFSSAGRGLGGSIAACSSEVNLTDCTFSSNAALGPDGYYGGGYAPFRVGGNAGFGGAIWAINSAIFLERCAFFGNSAKSGRPFETAMSGKGGGGAINLETGCRLTAIQSSFTSNLVVAGDGGALRLNSPAEISSSIFISNLATGSVANVGLGGAISADASLNLHESIFHLNTIIGGPAHNNGMPIGYAIAAEAGKGGAVAVAGPTQITNTIFFENSASGGPGAPFLGPSPFGMGGAIYVASNVTAVTHATLASNWLAQSTLPSTNSVPIGSAIFIETNAVLQLKASIIGGHSMQPAVSGAVSDLGFNVSSEASPAFSDGSSLNNTDPLLRYRNDAAIPILELRPESPAVGRVSSRVSAVDVRGFIRPSVFSDSGAVELGAPFGAHATFSPGRAVEFRMGLFAAPLRVWRTEDFGSWQEGGFTVTDSWKQQMYRPAEGGLRFFYFFQAQE